MLKQPLLVALTLAFTNVAHAQTSYPAKPIRVVVPYPAGGTSDILTRMVGAKLTEAWGQQVISDSRPGANGNIAGEHVARSPADGYTLLIATDAQLTINPHVYARLP